MTEAEWLACNDLPRLINSQRNSAKQRKLRLFACACARLAWAHLAEGPGRGAVAVSERFADGMASNDELGRSWRESNQAWRESNQATGLGAQTTGLVPYVTSGAALVLSDASYAALYTSDHAPIASVPASTPRRKHAIRLQRQTQLTLFRCTFGNPFRETAMPPEWISPAVARVAQVAYEEREMPSGHIDNSRLAVLSDALEEAGCTDADLLSHFRSPGPHVRGCWALDLILGKA